jgi:hypothetical protein
MRPRKPENERVNAAFTVRLSDDLSDRVVRAREALQDQARFVDVTTADTLRHLISEGARRMAL